VSRIVGGSWECRIRVLGAALREKIDYLAARSNRAKEIKERFKSNELHFLGSNSKNREEASHFCSCRPTFLCNSTYKIINRS